MTVMPRTISGEDAMLDAPDFRRVASAGFGDPHNTHAWSMEWFQGRLYVGTARDILWIFRRMGGFAHLDPCPIPLHPAEAMDLRAQIWCYTPDTGSWEQVYTAPRVPTAVLRLLLTLPWRRVLRARRLLSRQGRQRRAGAIVRRLFRSWRAWVSAGFRGDVARDVGYRNMTVYRDRHGVEALYAVNIGPQGHILRTTDGHTFEVITPPGSRRHVAFGFRPMVSFRDRLYTSTVGHPMFPNVSAYPAVLETDDPAQGAQDASVWRPVSAPGFGDPDNLAIFEMTVFHDQLYAATGNLKGFQIWKTDVRGAPPYHWQQVIADGGYQGTSHNAVVVSMCPLGEWLYIGSGRALAVRDRLDPTPGEVIRIAPDGSWEVVAGEARHTPQGFKSPVSGMPAGFGNPFAQYVWRMEAHDGWLYAGTHDATTDLLYTPRERWSPGVTQWVDRHGGVDKAVAEGGGFDLWRTRDGVHWTCLTHTGFGNPFNRGLRTLKSTPVGLFAGSVNFFTEARDAVTGEPRGGTEIWWGSS
jgi:hypothetical protein